MLTAYGTYHEYIYFHSATPHHSLNSASFLSHFSLNSSVAIFIVVARSIMVRVPFLIILGSSYL